MFVDNHLEKLVICEKISTLKNTSAAIEIEPKNVGIYPTVSKQKGLYNSNRTWFPPFCAFILQQNLSSPFQFQFLANKLRIW